MWSNILGVGLLVPASRACALAFGFMWITAITDVISVKRMSQVVAEGKIVAQSEVVG